jgi:S-(hydroxymethyl)glutathione dehydrogenase / alcohol dehydrogenase
VRMKAAVLDAPAQPFEVCEVELDPPHGGEALVRVAASGLCGSDLKALDGLRPLAPFPVILGHEAAGVVESVGEGVERLSPGDHVVVSILPSCRRCASCRRGRPNHCMTTATAMRAGNLLDGSSRLSLDGQRLNHFLTISSFAEYAVVPESAAVVIDPAMPLDCAALIGCAVLTGYGAVWNSARVEPGASVAVFGCGGVGLSAVQGARIAGAGTIVAVDIHPGKLAIARAVGATETVDAHTDDPVGAVREATNGGADYAFEAAGRSEAIEQAWASLAVGGLLTVIGTLPSGTKLALDADPLIEEKRIGGCYLGSASPERDVPALVECYLAGELLLDELVTRRIGLTELNEGFARLREGTEARQVAVFDDIPMSSTATHREELHVS